MNALDRRVIAINPRIPSSDIHLEGAVAICSQWSTQAIVHAALHRRIGHWVQKDGGRLAQELKQAEKMIIDPEGFHLDPVATVLQGELQRWEMEFSSIDQKDQVLTRCRSALEAHGTPHQTIADVLFIADELFTNALFNAPGDVLSHRSGNARLPAGRTARIVVASDSDWVWVAVRDPFGTYSPSRALSRVLTSFLCGVGGAIQMEEGGAGIGTRLALDRVTSFTVQVRSLESTWVGGLLPLNSGHGQSAREEALKFKNLHIAVSKGGQMGQFKFQEKRDGSKLHLELQGRIDEDAKFETIGLSGITELKLDLSAVTAINSCGIREWIKWLKALSPQAKVQIRGCQKEIVDQFNMIDGFLPKSSVVESFYVPYFCEACDVASSVLLTLGKEYQLATPPKLSETIPCSNCAKPAEIDVLDGQYLRFLTR